MKSKDNSVATYNMISYDIICMMCINIYICVCVCIGRYDLGVQLIDGTPKLIDSFPLTIFSTKGQYCLHVWINMVLKG